MPVLIILYFCTSVANFWIEFNENNFQFSNSSNGTRNSLGRPYMTWAAILGEYLERQSPFQTLPFVLLRNISSSRQDYDPPILAGQWFVHPCFFKNNWAHGESVFGIYRKSISSGISFYPMHGTFVSIITDVKHLVLPIKYFASKVIV